MLMDPPANTPATFSDPPPENVTDPFDRSEQPDEETEVDPEPLIVPDDDNATRHGCVPPAPVGAEVCVTTSAVPVVVIVCVLLELNSGEDMYDGTDFVHDTVIMLSDEFCKPPQ